MRKPGTLKLGKTFLHFQVPKGKQAGVLYSTLSILWAIICGSHRTLGTARAIVETVDGHIKKMQDFAKKLKVTEGSLEFST